MTKLQTNIAKLKKYLAEVTHYMQLSDDAQASGVACSYFEGNSKVGLKVFRYQKDFAKSVKLHKQILMEYNCAPFIYGSFSVFNERLRTTFHVLIVEHVVILQSLKSWAPELFKERLAVAMNFTEDMEYIANDSDDAFLYELVNDLHRNNIGFRGDRPLMIDFSI